MSEFLAIVALKFRLLAVGFVTVLAIFITTSFVGSFLIWFFRFLGRLVCGERKDGVLSPLSSLIRTLSWMLHASSELLGREGIGIVNGKEGKGSKEAVGY